MLHIRHPLLVPLLVLLITVPPAAGRAQSDRPKAAPEVQALLDQAGQAMAARRFEPAGTLFEQAAAKARELQDRKGEADALRGRGTAYRNTGHPQEALEHYLQSLALARAVGDELGEASSMHNSGLIYADTGRHELALQQFLPALAFFRKTGVKAGEVAALAAIGNSYGNTGRPEKSIEYIRQALALYREAGNKLGESRTLANLGRVYYLTGQSQLALEQYHQALTLHREAGRSADEADVLSLIGVVYWSTDQIQRAVEYYEQALPLFRQLGNKDGEAVALGRLGLAYLDAGQPAKALEYQTQALPLYRLLGDKKGEAATLSNLGNIASKSKQPQKALDYYRQALPLYRAVEDPRSEAIMVHAMGQLHRSTGDLITALAEFRQALAMSRQVLNLDGEAQALTQIGDVLTLQGDHAGAVRHYDQAIVLAEQLRSNLGGLSESKSSYLQLQLPLYYSALRAHLRLHHAETAFARAQQTKARSLLDLMASGRVEIGRDLSEEEQRQWRELRSQADTLNQQLVKEGVVNEPGAKKRFAAVQGQLRQTESRLQTLTDTLYARHPRLAAKTVATTATLSTVGKALPAGTALLDFVILSDRQIGLFLVVSGSSGPKLTALTLPVDYNRLQKQAAAFRAACADPRRDYGPAARALYSQLLAPAATQLKGAKRLIICPDGGLWDVPFQSLISGRRSGPFLAERFEIAYAYSATGAQAALAGRTGRRKPERPLLVLANPDFGSVKRFGDLKDLPGQRPIDRPSRPFDLPSRPIDAPSRPIDTPSRPIDTPSRPIDAPSRPLDSPSRAFDLVSRAGRIAPLPGTQQEADALKKDFPDAIVLLGTRAQESAAKAEASKYRYLHFATHGFFNDASPLLSSIVLAQPEKDSKEDGFLTAREIFEMNLSAEMVVLSACNTARGVARSGDGVIGLTWALFVAGCPTQVVSQWSVDDASTATLMESFYANLVKKKMAKGTALRQASLTLMKDPKHRHPYYWAPFVLIGDWR